jgi:hypothetical protein
MAQKLDLFSSSSEREKTSTLSGALERANHNHWTSHADANVYTAAITRRGLYIDC